MVAHVHIFGPLKMQNELVGEFLAKSRGIMCRSWEDSAPTISHIKTDQNSLILLDCVNTDPVDLRTRLEVGLIFSEFSCLFNVSPALKICRDAVNKGVQGIFLENENTHASTNKGV
jgi:hypothetical protein